MSVGTYVKELTVKLPQSRENLYVAVQKQVQSYYHTSRKMCQSIYGCFEYEHIYQDVIYEF